MAPSQEVGLLAEAHESTRGFLRIGGRRMLAEPPFGFTPFPMHSLVPVERPTATANRAI
jgi:hypothetical protein